MRSDEFARPGPPLFGRARSRPSLHFRAASAGAQRSSTLRRKGRLHLRATAPPYPSRRRGRCPQAKRVCTGARGTECAAGVARATRSGRNLVVTLSAPAFADQRCRARVHRIGMTRPGGPDRSCGWSADVLAENRQRSKATANRWRSSDPQSRFDIFRRPQARR